MRQPPIPPKINVEEHQMFIFNTDLGGKIVLTMRQPPFPPNQCWRASNVHFQHWFGGKGGLNKFCLNIYVHDCSSQPAKFYYKFADKIVILRHLKSPCVLWTLW